MYNICKYVSIFICINICTNACVCMYVFILYLAGCLYSLFSLPSMSPSLHLFFYLYLSSSSLYYFTYSPHLYPPNIFFKEHEARRKKRRRQDLMEWPLPWAMHHEGTLLRRGKTLNSRYAHYFIEYEVDNPSKVLIKISSATMYIKSYIQDAEAPRIDDVVI